MGLIARRPGWAARWLWPALLSLPVTAAIVSTASACMFLTTSSEFVSLLFEPLSMLLVPGLLSAMAIPNLHRGLFRHGPHPTETHDFSNIAVVVHSAIFYFLFFLIFFHRRALRRQRELTESAPSR